MIFDFEKTKEYKLGLLDEPTLLKYFQNNEGVSYIHHNDNPIIIGSKFLLKVNTSVGISEKEQLDDELKKIKLLTSLAFMPDCIMDHTPINLDEPLWKYLVNNTNLPIGVVPVYTVFNKEKGIDKNKLLDRIEEMAEGGVNFMTFHPTATKELFNMAKLSRKIPTSSWGGSLVLKDIDINNRNVNVIADNFLDILAILKKYNITLSVGSVFRPARIDEALDNVHIEETKMQKKYIDIAKSNSINVIMEGIGHIPLSSTLQYCKLIRENNVPLMPLGPMPTDATIGFDHISAAIGAAIAAMQGNVGIINSVTRDEHLGGIPKIETTIEGLKTARVVAHIINLERFKYYSNIDKAISDNRASKRTCIANGGIFNLMSNPENKKGCSRCNTHCPLTLMW